MTLIDETTLREALHEAAADFEVSREATDRILNEASGADARERARRVPSFVRQRSGGRTALIAAALVLVVGAMSLPLMRDEGRSAKNSNAQHRAASGQTVQGSGFSGNTTKSGSATSLSAATAEKTAVTVTGAQAVATSSHSLKIESSGTVGLTVSNGSVQTSLAKLGSLAKEDGGFVVSTEAVASTQKSANYSNGTIVLQVPQRLFATLVTQVQHVGRSTSINVQSSDVTSQYVDLQARITALDASRRQYLSIMTRATTIGDILAVQAQLNSLQSQIEQLQGQMNLLDNETTYGSLTVRLTEAGHLTSAKHSSGLAKAWRDSIEGFVAGFEWLIRITGPMLFVALLLGALYGVTKFIRRAIRRRRI
jgi:hypothetical protein